MEAVHLLVNRAAGAARGHLGLAEVVRQLGDGGAGLRVHEPRSRAEARAVIAEVVDGGAERLVVAGGDGLVHDAVQHLAGSGTVLGVVPFGSGNDFARAVGLAGDRAAACRAALGPWRPLDLLRCGPTRVATIATLGFSARVTAAAELLRVVPGSARYSLATLLALPGLRPEPIRLRVGGRVHDLEAVLVAVANTPYFGGGMAICPGADPTDGRLEVGVVDAVGRVELLRFFPQVFAGRHRSHPAFRTFVGPAVDIEAPTSPGYGDGELLGAGPWRFEVEPGALRVAAPPPPSPAISSGPAGRSPRSRRRAR